MPLTARWWFRPPIEAAREVAEAHMRWAAEQGLSPAEVLAALGEEMPADLARDYAVWRLAKRWRELHSSLL